MGLKYITKSLIFTFLSAAAILAVCSCVEPVGIADFLKDEKVLAIIENRDNGQTITLDPNSDTGLAAGNGTITKLNPNKYYKVVCDGVVSYVKADGTLSKSLKEIGFVTGAAITGLENKKTYKVNEAIPFAGVDLSYLDLTGNSFPAGFTKADINKTTNTVSIPAPSVKYYMDFPLDTKKNYEVMMIPISGDSKKWDDSKTSAYYNGADSSKPETYPINDTHYVKYDPAKPIGIAQYRADGKKPSPDYLMEKNILELEKASYTNNINDYIFVEYDNKNVTNFFVITVDIQPRPKTPITFSFTFDAVVDYSPGSVEFTFKQSDLGGVAATVQITVSNPFYFTPNSFKWYYGNPALGVSTELTSVYSANGTLDLNMDNSNTDPTIRKLLVPGSHEITVTAEKDLLIYSKVITLKVTK